MNDSQMSTCLSANNKMPDSIRVAIASNHKGMLDGHFGSCLQFLIYQVSPNEIQLLELRSTTGKKFENEKNDYLAELISDCHILYVASIGGPAAAKVVKYAIHPVKYIDEANAVDVLRELQSAISCKPPPWLAKVMGHSEQSRIRFATE